MKNINALLVTVGHFFVGFISGYFRYIYSTNYNCHPTAINL